MRTVSAVLVGICPRCGVFAESDEVLLENIPGVTQHCCGMPLTLEDRGLKRMPDGTKKKIRWVGPNGEWTDKEPTVGFPLHRYGLWVVPRPHCIHPSGFVLIDGGRK